jgi:hypothetical protein
MRIKILLFLLLFFSTSLTSFGQKKKIAKLPEHLKEISGLAFLNDTVLIAHNDGGNDATLYFLNLKGEQFHSVKVENAKNKDWEDITVDGKGNLFIGDIGNNGNNRDNLCIYKISSFGILKKESVTAEKINFRYSEQKDFPPDLKNLHFDAEALAYNNDSLYIFTKCRTEPFDGKSFCYGLPTKPESYKLIKDFDLNIGKEGWWKDCITAAEIKNNKCYLLTYNRIIIYTIHKSKFTFSHSISLDTISQYESMAINSKGIIYIADEQNELLGGGNLYTVTEPNPKKK